MNKENKRLLAGIGIIIVLAFLFVNFRGGAKTLSLSSDPETQFKQEYITIWADNTDSNFDIFGNGNCKARYLDYDDEVKNIQQQGFGCVYKIDSNNNYLAGVYFENEKFVISGGGRGGTVYTTDSITSTASGWDIAPKQKLIGQEIAIVLGGNANFGKFGVECWTIPGGTTCESIVSYVLKPHTLEPTRWDVVKVSGERLPFGKVGEITGNPLTLSFASQGTGTFNIHYVGYKAQYECDISQDEVYIQETFGAGQTFSIKDLQFSPTKFCKTTRPFVLRNLQQGETAVYPDPIPDFNRGVSVTVPQGSIYVVNYATYYVSGVTNRCGVNQANVKNSNGQWVCQDVIKPVEVVVQCKVDTDCYVPTKSECFGYFKGCISNKCAYDETIPDSPVCKNEVVTIVKQIQEVEKRILQPVTGSNSFSFYQNVNNPSFSIGDQLFSATQPEFLCALPSDSDFVNAPSPSSDCWQTTATFGNSVKVKDQGLADIHPLIRLQYYAGGKLTRGTFRNPEDWGNSFIFTINSPEAMKFNVEDSGFVIKDSNKKILINLENNLPSGNIIIKYQQKVKATNQFLPEQMIEKNVIKGNNSFEIPMNTQNGDINTITLQAFYKINANSEVLIPSDRIILNYDVVTQLPSVEKIVEVTKETVVPVVEEREKIVNIERVIEVTKIPLWVWGLFVLAVLVIGFLIWKKRKN